MIAVLSFLLRNARWPLLVATLAGAASGGGSALLMALINRQLTPGRLGWTVAGLSFAAAVLFVVGTGHLSRVLLVRIQQRTEYRIRLEICARVLATPLRQLEEIGTSRILASLTQDVSSLSGSLSALPNLSVNAAMLAGCLVYLIWLSPGVFLGLILFLAAMLAVNIALNRRGDRLLVQVREAYDALMSHFRALNEGIKELKLHGARSRAFFDESLEPSAEELRRRNGGAQEAFALANTWSQLVFFGFVGMLLFVLPRVRPIDLGLLTSYTLAAFFLRGPLTVLIDLLPGFTRAAVALRKLERLGLSLAPAGPAVLAEPPAGCRRVDLLGVTHTYYREQEDDNFVLGPVDLTLRAGELVILAGGNGSGKTTLAKMLCGLYPPESGEMRLDGRLVTTADLPSYRQLFSVVFSDFFLFDTLLGLSGPDLQSQAARYLTLLQLDRKVRLEGQALSTIELSRGQRKRLALLTAYLEDRPFYVFDEWASDQDPLFKDIFYRRLLPDLRARGKGVLVISHDIHYHDVADRLVRLDYGRLDTDTDTPHIASRTSSL